MGQKAFGKLQEKLEIFLDKNFDLKERVKYFNDKKIYSLEIELTNTCTLACEYCYNSSRESIQQLSFAKAKELIILAKKYGIKKIVWLGGEPTLNQDWIKIINFSKKKGIKNELWSNGTTLDKKTISSIIKCVDTFVLHLDSIDPQSFNNLQIGKTDPKTHNQILQGFENLLLEGFLPSNIRVNIVLTKKNYSHLDKTIIFFKQYKIQSIILIPVYPAGRGENTHDELCLNPQKLLSAFKKRSKIESKPELMLLGPSEYCKQYQLTTTYVTANGNITPYAGVDIQVGNIYETSINEILSKYFKALSFSKQVSTDGYTNLLSGACNNCENTRFCFGTRANSFFTDKSFNHSDKNCWKITNLKFKK